MTRKNFLLLLSLSKEQASYAQGMLARVKRDLDATAKPAWIDSRGAGICISTELSAREVWTRAIPDHLHSAERAAFKDMAVLQLGPDCVAWPESQLGAWLNSHRLD